MKNIQFILPRFFLPNLEVHQESMPNFSALLTDATVSQPHANAYQQLFKMFELPIEGELPIAAVTAVADGLDKDGCWLRADPVGLHVDWTHVFMLGNSHLQISQSEASEYAKLINHYLKEDGVQLHTPHAKRWYFKLNQYPKEVAFRSPFSVYGKAIIDYLPRGAKADYWLHQFNEIQMLLFDSQLNQQRLALNQPTIDALWPWGAGMLPTETKNQMWATVIADSAVAEGLAILSGANYVNFSGNNDLTHFLTAVADHSLFCIASCEWLDGSTENLKQIDTKFFQPIYDFWKQMGEIEIRLYLADGSCYALQRTNKGKRTFPWKKRY